MNVFKNGDRVVTNGVEYVVIDTIGTKDEPIVKARLKDASPIIYISPDKLELVNQEETQGFEEVPLFAGTSGAVSSFNDDFTEED